MKRIIIDGFCGGGGATKGYQEAGFYVIGVDLYWQSNYCGDEFYCADALDFIAKYSKEADAISCSPKCQESTGLQRLAVARNGSYPIHENQIAKTRKALQTPVHDVYIFSFRLAWELAGIAKESK